MVGSVPAPPPIVAVRDVLPTLGFIEAWGSMTDQRPGFVFEQGNLVLTANQVTNEYLRPQFFFGGVGIGANSLHSISFAIPLMVESAEQVVAWIVFGIGLDFRPSQTIDWFDRGKAWQHLLPWEQHRKKLLEWGAEHSRLRRARPQCTVSREWMRLLNRQLREANEVARDDDEFVLGFDGHTLTLALPGKVMGAPASGPAPWATAYRGRISMFAGRWRRLMSDPVEVGIWEGQLEIDRMRIEVVAVSGPAVATP